MSTRAIDVEEESFAVGEASTDHEASDVNSMSTQDLKAALLDSFYGSERGLSARSEIRAEVNELITQLESANPTPSPTEDPSLSSMEGVWKLVYTSNSELIAVLALSKLPFVEVGDITQKIDSIAGTVVNTVGLTVPFSRTSFSTTASFEIRSPKRLQLRLTKTGIQTPELLTDLELPSNISIMGQFVDLSQLKQALTPVNERVMGIFGQVNTLLNQTPKLQFDLKGEAQTWQLNTYLDADTRITRGDGGSVFVYVKDVSLANN